MSEDITGLVLLSIIISCLFTKNTESGTGTLQTRQHRTKAGPGGQSPCPHPAALSPAPAASATFHLPSSHTYVSSSWTDPPQNAPTASQSAPLPSALTLILSVSTYLTSGLERSKLLKKEDLVKTIGQSKRGCHVICQERPAALTSTGETSGRYTWCQEWGRGAIPGTLFLDITKDARKWSKILTFSNLLYNGVTSDVLTVSFAGSYHIREGWVSVLYGTEILGSSLTLWAWFVCFPLNTLTSKCIRTNASPPRECI